MERILGTEGIEARSYTWEQLVFEVGLNVRGAQYKGPWAQWIITCALHADGVGEPKKTAKDRMNWASVMLERDPQPKNWSRVSFSMKCILAMAPKISSISFQSWACVNAKIAYKSKMSQPRRTRNVIIVGRTISSLSSIRITSQARFELGTQGKMSQQVSGPGAHGFKYIKETQGMDQESQKLCALGRRKMA